MKRVFFMLDSNGCGGASALSLANKHTKTSTGFGKDQIEWYTAAAEAIKKSHPDTKLSFAFHIQLQVFADAYSKYNYPSDLPINIDTLEDKDEGEFGYIGKSLKGAWDTDYKVWNGIKALGVDSIFVGHEHCNSASVMYDGVRLQYGQKSSTYDRANYLKADGSIEGTYNDTAGDPIVGGTAIPVSEADGAIVDPYIVYYDKNKQTEVPPKPVIGSAVFDFNGKDFNTEVTTSGINSTNYVAKRLSDGSAPIGYTGDVFKGEDTYLISTGFAFPKKLNLAHAASFKVRMYVTDYAKSGQPLLRIYDDTNNSICANMPYPSDGYGQWVEIDVLPMLASVKSLNENGALLPFSLVYRCYYGSGAVPKVYFDSITIEYTADLYQFDEVEKPTELFAESGIAQYRNDTYYRYTFADFGQTEALQFKQNDSVIYKVGNKGYSFAFNFTPKNLEKLNLMLLTDETGRSGYSVGLTPNGVVFAGKTLNYKFALNQTFGVEVGVVRFERNDNTGAGNGNTGYVFLKIDGKTIDWRLIELYAYRNKEYFALSSSSSSINDMTLESYNVVEYRSAGGKLLMKELASGNIQVTQQKIDRYAAGREYSGVSVNGGAFSDGQTLTKGVHTVTISLNVEPNTDEYGGIVTTDTV